MTKKIALIVRGGWDGHQPVEATNHFIPHLEANGFQIRVEDSSKIYADAEYMKTVDLIIQCNTMTKIKKEEFLGLRTAIENGTGMAGWHGGIIDSYRETSDYMHLMGAQFATHPSKEPSLLIGEQSDNYIPFTVNMLPAAANHEITKGLSDFTLTTEQYWVLHDDYIDVLATTTHPARPWQPWNREILSPVIWTRQWGKGKIFVTAAGHNFEIIQDKNVETIIKRGMLWASR